MFNWLFGKVEGYPPFDPKWHVDLQRSIDQVTLIGREQALANIQLGDYIMWSETSGSPGDTWYCGRSCDGVVIEIQPNMYVVQGVGYYGINDTILTCYRRTTIGSVGPQYALRSHGVTVVVKNKDIVWVK